MANKKKSKKSNKAKPINTENNANPPLPGFNEGATCGLDGVNNKNVDSSVTCKVVISKAECDPCVKKGLERFQINMSAEQSTNRAHRNVGTGSRNNNGAAVCVGEEEERCLGVAANSGMDVRESTGPDDCDPMDIFYNMHHQEDVNSVRPPPNNDCPPFTKADVTFDPIDPNWPSDLKEMLRPYVTRALGSILGDGDFDNSTVHTLALNAMMEDVNGTCKRTDEIIPLADGCVVAVSFAGESGHAQDWLVDDMELYDEVKDVGPTTANENCVYPNCRQVPHVTCVACNRTVYCNAKHQKLDKKNHEKHCLPYRFLDKVGVGKYAIAARDIDDRGAILIGDEPIAVFPVSPLIHVGKSSPFPMFPKNYCVNCCKEYSDDGYVGKCSKGCPLSICLDKSRCFPHERGHYHAATECKVLRKLYDTTAGEHYQLALDHNMVALLRCVSLTLNTSNENYLCQKLIEMSSHLKMSADSFRSRLHVYRKYVSVETYRVGDEDLWRMETAIQRFGRNCVRGSLMVYDRHREPPPYQSYVKCVFTVASHVLHSCVPNCYISCNLQNYATVRSLKEIKKGEPLTVCYDVRSLFYPTWKRRNHLLVEFGLTCKCKRCSMQSELGTFFSAFPCSNPSCLGKGSRGRTVTAFIVPESTLDNTSDWSCISCKKKKVKPIRVEFLLMTLEIELKQASDSALSLWTRIEELVEARYVHWNNFVVFHACIKFFQLLWEELNGGDVKVLTVYSNLSGLQFLKAAETVLTLTKTFLPDAYPQDYILALRLSGVIIMRDLSDKLSTQTIKIEHVETTIKDIYFRSEFKFPLYRIPIPPHPMFQASSSNLNVVEGKAILQLTEALRPNYGPVDGAADNETHTKGQFLMILHKHKIKDDPNLVNKIRQKQLKQSPGFPWALKV